MQNFDDNLILMSDAISNSVLSEDDQSESEYTQDLSPEETRVHMSVLLTYMIGTSIENVSVPCEVVSLCFGVTWEINVLIAEFDIKNILTTIDHMINIEINIDDSSNGDDACIISRGTSSPQISTQLFYDKLLSSWLLSIKKIVRERQNEN